MKDPELDVLLEELETRTDLTVADFEGVARGLGYLLPEAVAQADGLAARLDDTVTAIHIAERAFPNWRVILHGRANDADGRWHCLLRETEADDNDEVIGSGRSPVLAQAILAATMRLAMSQTPD